MSEVARSAVVVGSGEPKWHSAGKQAGEFAVLRAGADGSLTVLNRMSAGDVGALHAHDRGEEFVVIEGSVRIGPRELRAGDHLYIEPGELHRAEALTDCRFVTMLHGRREGA